MYEVTGIITFWILRIGLVVFLVFLIIDFNAFRQSVTRTVKTSKDTWMRRSLTVKEGMKENPWYCLIMFLVLVLIILSWATLLIV